MMIESNRRRRPPPIQILKLEKRQDVEEYSPGTSVNKTPSLFTTPTPTVTSEEGGRTSIAWLPNVATSSNFSPGRMGSTQVPARSTSSLGLTTHTQLSMHTSRLSTTSSTSPTTTIFMIVTQSLNTPKEEQESPGATRTVFNSWPPQVVTVTAAAQVTNPLADDAGTSKTQRESALPPGALKPLIALGVIASVSVVVIVAVILWRRRKRKKNKTVD